MSLSSLTSRRIPKSSATRGAVPVYNRVPGECEVKLRATTLTKKLVPAKGRQAGLRDGHGGREAVITPDDLAFLPLRASGRNSAKERPGSGECAAAAGLAPRTYFFLPTYFALISL